jgi:hypothetical protein
LRIWLATPFHSLRPKHSISSITFSQSTAFDRSGRAASERKAAACRSDQVTMSSS